MSRNESEHSPLSGMDEYMIHQYPEPLRVMWTSDARTYERLWFVVMDRKGQLLIVQGCANYPSLDTAEAFSIIVHSGQHTAVRAHRLLGDDRMEMRLGPINAQVVRPFREWRLTLDSNQQGISYDLRWLDTKRAVFQRFGPAPSQKGRLANDNAGYETFGRVEGWVNYKGKRIELSIDESSGTRDHHWGTRNGVGGPAHYQPLPDTGYPDLIGDPGPGGVQFHEFEFKDWSLWINRVLYNIGDPRPGAGPRVLNREAKLKFDPESKVFLEGTVRFTLSNCEVKEVHFQRLGNQIAALRCGMYPQGGGTLDKGIWQGMYVGDDVVEGETLDMNNPKVQTMVNGLHDNQCLVTCSGETTVGLFESMDPTLYEWCRLNAPGYSLLE